MGHLSYTLQSLGELVNSFLIGQPERAPKFIGPWRAQASGPSNDEPELRTTEKGNHNSQILWQSASPGTDCNYYCMTVKGLLLMACSVNLGYFVPVHLHLISTTAQYFPGDNALLLFPLLIQVGFRWFLSSSTGTGPKPISTVPYPGSHDLCCPIRETSALAWEKMCPQEAMRQELLRQPWPPKMKATVWAGLPQQRSQQRNRIQVTQPET